MNDLILLGCDFYSMVPIILYFTGIYIGFYNNILTETLPFVIFIYINDLGTKLIKSLPYPGFMWDITRRPEGAFNTDYFSRNGLAKKDSPGFPSGHMTGITTFCIYMILRKKGNMELGEFINENIIFLLFNILVILLMGFSRWYKKCHNIFQILGGIIYGSITTYFYYEYIGKYLIDY
jgi:membrane-associated phospholipid phosphatase